MSIFPTLILLAIDGSKEAELAATTAVDLAESTNSELHIVHVGFERYRDEAQEELDTEMDMIRESGSQDIQAHLEFGRPDTAIIDLAEELGKPGLGRCKASPARKHLGFGSPPRPLPCVGSPPRGVRG